MLQVTMQTYKQRMSPNGIVRTEMEEDTEEVPELALEVDEIAQPDEEEEGNLDPNSDSPENLPVEDGYEGEDREEEIQEELTDDEKKGNIQLW
jgi:hypothetical protein